MLFGTPRIGIRIYALTGVVLLLLIGAAVYDLSSERRRIVIEQEAEAARLSDIIEEHTKRVVGSVDVVLRAAAAQIAEEAPDLADASRIEAILLRFQKLSPEIRDLALFDRAANRVAGTRGPPGSTRNIGERSYFRIHRDGVVDDIFMAEPIVGPITRDIILPLSRRIGDAGGTFLGVVVATVDPERFSGFHRSLGLRHAGAVNILDQTGMVLVRTPDAEGAAGRTLVDPGRIRDILAKAERGITWAPSPLDGTLRLVGYRAIAGLPLMASVSFSSDSIFAPWERRAALVAAVVAAIVVAVSAFAHGIVLSARRERRMEERQAASKTAELSAKTQLADAMNVLADGIALYDADDRLVFCNRCWLELYPESADVMRPGLQFEHLIRLGVGRGLYPEANADPEQWIAERMARHQSPGSPWELRFGQSWRQITERRTATGGIISLHRDITERKRSEGILRARARQNAAVAELGRLALTGPPRSRMIEHATRLAAAGIEAAAAEIVLLPEAADEVPAKPPTEIVKEAMASAGPVVKADDESGSTIAVSIRGKRAPVGALVATLPPGRRLDSEELDFLSAITAVVSQQRIGAETQAELIHTQRLESVGRLTGGVAHDFNNLLTVVIGNADWLATQFPPDTAEGRAAGLILKSAERGADVVQRLLVFARRQSLATRSVDVNALISGMSTLMRHALTSRIGMELDLDPDLPPARTDPTQLESALMNIVINARDAIADAGTLSIATRLAMHSPAEAAQPGAFVEIMVTDSGHGMPPDVVAQVFEPFFTTKEPGKGTGLGLSMVHGFVLQSGGDVAVESVQGLGTRVRLHLPADISGVAEPRPAAATVSPPGDHRTEHILVVEDDSLVRRYVVDQLENRGFRVTAAERADQALDILRSDARFDLLFSDIVMPGPKNGWALAEAARLLYPELAILLTTGHAVPPEHGDGPSVEILHKPYRPAELLARIEAILDRRPRKEA